MTEQFRPELFDDNDICGIIYFNLNENKVDFIQGFLKKNEKKLVRFSNFTVRYIDDVLSLKEPAEFVDRIFPIEIEINDTTDIIVVKELRSELFITHIDYF
jgi:uncharacterized protein YaeQ